jgi:hypothetical protein
MKKTSKAILLFCSLTACNTLNAQLSDSPKPPPLPPGVKEQVEKMQKQALKNAGIQTDESSLASFVKKIKTIKIGEDTPDDVIRLLGKPMGRSTFQGTETLSYMSMPSMDISVGTSIQIGVSGKVSAIKVNKTQHGAAFGTGGEIFTKGSWETPGQVSTSTPSSKESGSQSDQFPLKEAAPENPTEGQIYFNKTDKHFYGWDGTSWLKMDSKP